MRIVVALAIGVLVGGCAPSLLDYESRVHVVRTGETLYTIAWRYGLDYRDLARWNALGNPDFIRVGQRISLRPNAAAARPADAPAGTASAGTAPPGTAPPGTAPPARPRPLASGAPAPTPPRPLPAPANLPAPAWVWPADGQITSGFGAAAGIPTGIAIAGERGQRIRAAAAGRVVYVGTGLAGYGQLVIIKHNDTYLSAYGHTEAVLIAQGQEVQRSQAIAAMGLGPRRQPRLHFEIRRNGVPVDPLTLLGRR